MAAKSRARPAQAESPGPRMRDGEGATHAVARRVTGALAKGKGGPEAPAGTRSGPRRPAVPR